jgi:hypothetical protein
MVIYFTCSRVCTDTSSPYPTLRRAKQKPEEPDEEAAAEGKLILIIRITLFGV